MKPKSNQNHQSHALIGALPVLLPMLLSPLVMAQSATWTGTTDTNWTVDGNWNPADFPGISDNTNASTSTNTDVATFDSAAGGVVNCTTTAHLNVGGVHFAGNPGSYMIQSGATGTGTKLIYFTVAGSVTMDSTVEEPQTFARTGFSGTTGTYTYENNS